MIETHPLPFLRETLLFLTLAGLLIPLLQRLRVNQVLGFLAVGALLGPNGLGRLAAEHPWIAQITFPDPGKLGGLAELGVLFLLFMIGLELSAERLWALRRLVFGAGTAQVLLSAGAIGAIAYAYGNSPASAMVLGLVLALSSTAVVMQLLSARRALGSPLGQAVFAVLLLQDLAVVPLLVLVDALGSKASGSLVGALSGALAKAVVAVTAIYLIGRRLLRPLFGLLLRKHQSDVFMALVLLATLGVAGLTWAAGLSMALGAFLAGVLLAETQYRHEVEVTVEPFKGLLMGLFFMSVGMAVDPRALAAEPMLLPLSVAGLVLLKTMAGSAVLMAAKLRPARALEGGLLLAQGGEFAFIVVGAAMASGLIPAPTGQFMTLVVALSMFTTPFVARAGQLLGDWLERRSGLSSDNTEHLLESVGDHVIVGGFGRVGQLLAQLLDAHGVRYVALEVDPKTVGEPRHAAVPLFYGSAARVELLERMHVERALAVVLTMDDPASTLHAVQAIRRNHPHIPVLARARDEKQAAALRDAGATLVVHEALEAGLQLAASALETLGIPRAAAARTVEQHRARSIGIPAASVSELAGTESRAPRS